MVWTGGLWQGGNVMNVLDLIEELYNLYLEKEDSLQIVEVCDNRLGFDLDTKDRPVDPYLEL